MSAAVLPLSLRIPVPPAPEDRPDWYTILLRVQHGEQLDPATVRAAAHAATTYHDAVTADLAVLHVAHAEAGSAALRVCAQLAEYRGCTW